jgi:hypothetical protein
MITNIATLSWRDITEQSLFIGILKINHIIVNQVIYFVAVINIKIIVDGHFI